MNKGRLISLNISQLLLAIDMLFFSKPDYLNILYISINLFLLLLSGIFLFIDNLHNIDKYFYWIFIIEYAIIPFIYVGYGSINFGLNFYYELILLVVYYAILVIGYIFNYLSEAILALFFIFSILFLKLARFGTDELAIDYTAAGVFLNGQNPYNPVTTSNLYEIIRNFNPHFFGTPLTTGGYVTWLGYPSLSFIFEIPARIFRFYPTYTLVFFYFFTVIIYYVFLKRKNMLYIFNALIPGIMININNLNYPAGGVDDIVWVFFVSLSLFVNNEKLKGVFYGLAVSYKQTPIALLPFYLIYLYKEKMNIKNFLIYSVLSFLITNGYFILLSPSQYFSAVLSPITSPLVGIGFGPSIFSFNGMFYIERNFFTISMIIIIIVGIILFLSNYTKFRNKWGAFPYFIFLAEYRVLWNYLMYWPWLGFVQESETKKNQPISKHNINTKSVIFITLIILSSLILVYHYNYTEYTDDFQVEIVKLSNSEIILNISYDPSSNNLPNYVYPQFRLFINQGMITANGYIWNSSTNAPLYSGKWEIVELRSPFPSFDIPNSTLVELQIYYENMLSVYYFKL